MNRVQSVFRILSWPYYVLSGGAVLAIFIRYFQSSDFSLTRP